MNVVHNCLDKYAGTASDERLAIRSESEDGQVRTMTYAELRRAVNRAANALSSLGVGRGDAVGVFMPMVPETVVAMLAVIKIGGLFLPLFSGYGAKAVASRLADAGAKVLFTADGCRRRGKVAAMKAVADEAAAAVPTLRHVIVLRHAGCDANLAPGRGHDWCDLIDGQPDEAETLATGADEPMMLLYTSGTTGRPKGAVHTHCGFPVKAAQDMLHGFDLHPDEVLYWMTDMGWMMGPWLVFGTLLLRRDDGPVRRRAGLPRPGPPLGAGRAPRRDDAGHLADARAGAAAARRRAGARRTTCRACANSARPASRGTPSPGAGCSTSSAEESCRSSTTPAAPKSPAASSAATS